MASLIPDPPSLSLPFHAVAEPGPLCHPWSGPRSARGCCGLWAKPSAGSFLWVSCQPAVRPRASVRLSFGNWPNYRWCWARLGRLKCLAVSLGSLSGRPRGDTPLPSLSLIVGVLVQTPSSVGPAGCSLVRWPPERRWDHPLPPPALTSEVAPTSLQKWPISLFPRYHSELVNLNILMGFNPWHFLSPLKTRLSQSWPVRGSLQATASCFGHDATGPQRKAPGLMPCPGSRWTLLPHASDRPLLQEALIVRNAISRRRCGASLVA